MEKKKKKECKIVLIPFCPFAVCHFSESWFYYKFFKIIKKKTKKQVMLEQHMQMYLNRSIILIYKRLGMVLCM